METGIRNDGMFDRGKRAGTKVLCIDTNVSLYRTVISRFPDYDPVFSPTIADALEKSFTYSPKLIVYCDNSGGAETVKFLSVLHKICTDSLLLIFLAPERMEEFRQNRDWIWGVFEKSQIESILKKELPKISTYISSSMKKDRFADKDSEDVISELEWLVWKETCKSSDGNFFGRNIIDNLTHTLSQGLGIGSLISRLELAEIFMKKDAEHFRLPKTLMASIVEDKNHLRERNENLDKFKTLFDLKITKQKTHSEELNRLTIDIIRELQEVASIKNQKIVHNDSYPDLYLFAHPDFLSFALRELYVNAMKFSPEGSVISSLFYSFKNRFVFRVMNDVSFMEGGVTGIPEEFTFRLFEPFFKLNNIFDERFYNLEFGMGMGLNLVQSMAKQSDCKVSVSEIVEEPSLERRIAAELRFPLFSEETYVRECAPQGV